MSIPRYTIRSYRRDCRQYEIRVCRPHPQGPEDCAVLTGWYHSDLLAGADAHNAVHTWPELKGLTQVLSIREVRPC